MFLLPMAFTHDDLSNIGDNFNYSVIARLRSGINLASANSDLGVVAHRILDTYPAQFRGSVDLQAMATPLNDRVAGRSRTLLLLLLGAVGFVLLIACANVANLLLTRAADGKKKLQFALPLAQGRYSCSVNF